MAKAPMVKELWMLWNPTLGIWGLASDDPDPYEALLCTTSFDAIVALQRHQQDLYEITLVPIRVI